MTNGLEPTPKFVIQDTSFDDIAKLRKMHAESWLVTYPNEEAGVSREWVQARVSNWTTPEGLAQSQEHFKDLVNNPDHLHRVAYDGDRLVGLAHVSKIDNKQHIEALYVDQEYWGTGLAHQLMEEIQQWVDADKLIDIEVVSYNKRARSFYEKFGYKVKPDSEGLFADTIPTVIMEKQGKSL